MSIEVGLIISIVSVLAAVLSSFFTQRRQSASESEERGAQKQLLKGIQETIEKINQKLEKISAINEKVTELEVKYSTLDGSMKRIHERIDGMQSRLDALDKVT